MEGTIYCLVPAPYFATFADGADYLPRDYAEEGFIHATRGDDLLEKVVNRVYPEYDGELLLLVIDESRVRAEVRDEQASDGNLYPHIYGPLNQDAITAVKQMIKENGKWTLPA